MEELQSILLLAITFLVFILGIDLTNRLKKIKNELRIINIELKKLSNIQYSVK